MTFWRGLGFLYTTEAYESSRAPFSSSFGKTLLRENSRLNNGGVRRPESVIEVLAAVLIWGNLDFFYYRRFNINENKRGSIFKHFKKFEKKTFQIRVNYFLKLIEGRP